MGQTKGEVMIQTPYYNTNNESGEELAQSKVKASHQEEHILDIFTHLTFVYGEEQLLTPSRVESQWINPMRGRNFYPPLTSIRRAITNLTKKGKLEKTNWMEKGKYGKKEHCWRLPIGETNQLELKL